MAPNQREVPLLRLGSRCRVLAYQASCLNRAKGLPRAVSLQILNGLLAMMFCAVWLVVGRILAGQR